MCASGTFQIHILRLEKRLSLSKRLGRGTFNFREMFLGRSLKKRLTLDEDLANTKIIRQIFRSKRLIHLVGYFGVAEFAV